MTAMIPPNDGPVIRSAQGHPVTEWTRALTVELTFSQLDPSKGLTLRRRLRESL
jgi:hypothetical protein